MLLRGFVGRKKILGIFPFFCLSIEGGRDFLAFHSFRPEGLQPPWLKSVCAVIPTLYQDIFIFSSLKSSCRKSLESAWGADKHLSGILPLKMKGNFGSFENEGKPLRSFEQKWHLATNLLATACINNITGLGELPPGLHPCLIVTGTQILCRIWGRKDWDVSRDLENTPSEARRRKMSGRFWILSW